MLLPTGGVSWKHCSALIHEPTCDLLADASSGEMGEMALPDSIVLRVPPVHHDVLGQARLELHERDHSRSWRQGNLSLTSPCT